MTTVQPPVPTAPPSSTASQIVAAALVLKGAEALAKLPPGTVLDGLVRNLGQRGQVAVQTAFGEVTLRTNAPLPDGARLTMQMGAATGQTMLKLTGIDGRPFAPQAFPQSSQPGDGQTMAGGRAMIGQSQAPRDPGPRSLGGQPPGPAAEAVLTSSARGGTAPTGIAATVLRPPSGTALPGQLPPGTGLIVRIAQVQPQIPGQGATPPPGPIPQAAMAGQAAGATSAAAASLPPSPLQTAPAAAPSTGAVIAGGNASPPAPAASLPSPSMTAMPPAPPGQSLPPVPQTLQGIVAANSHGGQTLVHTPVGVLSLSGGAAELPTGAAVTLDVVGRPIPPPNTPPTAAGLPPLPLPSGQAGGSWQTLGQALSLLQRLDPQAADEMMRALPQIGPHLAAGLAGAATAVRHGNRRGLIGDAALRALDSTGNKQSAARLEAEFEQEAAAVEKPAGGGEWRSMTLPMLDGAAIQEIRLSVRRPPPDDGDGGESGDGGRHEDGTRFLVDVTMSHFGPLQLDGLMRKGAKRFDLILRSKQPLDAEIRRDISALFIASCEAMGMAGTASFQATPTFIEVPRPAAVSGQGGLGGGVFA